jgi:hypothetical protein
VRPASSHVVSSFEGVFLPAHQDALRPVGTIYDAGRTRSFRRRTSSSRVEGALHWPGGVMPASSHVVSSFESVFLPAHEDVLRPSGPCTTREGRAPSDDERATPEWEERCVGREELCPRPSVCCRRSKACSSRHMKTSFGRRDRVRRGGPRSFRRRTSSSRVEGALHQVLATRSSESRRCWGGAPRWPPSRL